jgi:hypothetical protein
VKGNMMSKAVIAVYFLAFSSAALAQTPPPPVAPAPPVPASAPVAPLPPAFPFGAGDDMMMFVSSELRGRSVVKGAPYAATAVNETRQILSDGNRIERSSSIKLFRDGQGRTRQEQAGGAVFIHDVVTGKGYVLNTQKRSARELRVPNRIHVPPVPPIPPVPPVGATPPLPQPPKPHSQMSPDEARSWADEMRRWAREFTDRMRGEREERTSERNSERDERLRERNSERADRSERNVVITRDPTAGGSSVIADHVEVLHREGGHTAFPPIFSSPVMAPPGPGTTTTLGIREFDGVRAEGKRTTWTIPAGRIGNKLPIEIVSERWHSPELNVVVFTRYADPRSGERIYRLEGIKREEPDAELFKLPPDYTLKSPPMRDPDRK